MKRILMLLLMLATSTAFGHSGDKSYLNLAYVPQSATYEANLKVPLEHLDAALDLDANRDGAVSWGDIQSSSVAINGLIQRSLQLQRGSQQCAYESQGAMQLEELSSGMYLIVPFHFVCAVESGVGPVTLNYTLFFDQNPEAAALLNVENDEQITSYLISASNNSIVLNVEHPQALVFFQFVVEGIWHILIGFDHILFLVTLLIPIVLSAEKQQLAQVVKVVTAFTVAHSITLYLAANHLVVVSMGVIEFAIALSVALGAVLSLMPSLNAWRWLLALGFGLVHGFGFSNVLGDLIEDTQSLGMMLFSFNLGVELGQLLIVFALYPVLLWVSRNRQLRTATLTFSMVSVFFIGVFFMVERVSPVLI